MSIKRRSILMSGLFGAGWVGLRALATGIPASILASPRTARAADPGCEPGKPRYLVFSSSAEGDPMGCNVPGTYIGDPRICHPPTPEFASTQFQLGATPVTAAQIWSTLTPAVLAKTCFFHHATYTGGHGDAPKVNRLQGVIKQQEMLVSLIATNIASCLGTVQAEPVVLSEPARVSSNPLISYKGGVLPFLSARSLRDVLAAPAGPLAALQTIRDQHVDQLNALFKESGTSGQRAILDRYALSQTQVRSLSQQLLSDLATIKDGQSYADRNTAAAILLKMNVTPVVALRYGFGGDNHTDNGLTGEARSHVSSIAAINDLFARLANYGLADSVTLALQNVFGRTFVATDGDVPASNGRTHNGLHHCSIFIGGGFQGSVIGGLAPTTKGDYRAQGLDSTTGAGSDSGDLVFEDTLASAGKTLAAGLGVTRSVIDDQITKGKVISAALA